MKILIPLKRSFLKSIKNIKNVKNIFKNNEEIFHSIYTEKKWVSRQGGNLAYNSGSGSDIIYSKPYADKVKKYIQENNISSVIDVGCGDFRVGRNLTDSVSNIKYLGVECFQDIVDYNNKNFGTDRIEFVEIDFTQPISCDYEYKSYDLALVRQVLQHLDNRSIRQILRNLQIFNHVIITEHQTNNPKVFNRNISCGSGNRTEKDSGVYLDKEPFNGYVNRVNLLLSIPVDSKSSINSYVVSMRPRKKR